MRCSGRSASGGFGFGRPTEAAIAGCAGKSSISSGVDIGIWILAYFDKSAKGGKFYNPVAGVIDFFVLEFPRVRMRNENGAQARGNGGIDVGARTVADHIRQRRIQISVMHQTA